MTQRGRRYRGTDAFVADCEAILLDYGVVKGAPLHPARHLARYQARRLIELLVEDCGYRRGALREHTESRGSAGWVWYVELLDNAELSRRRRSA